MLFPQFEAYFFRNKHFRTPKRRSVISQAVGLTTIKNTKNSMYFR